MWKVKNVVNIPYFLWFLFFPFPFIQTPVAFVSTKDDIFHNIFCEADLSYHFGSFLFVKHKGRGGVIPKHRGVYLHTIVYQMFPRQVYIYIVWKVKSWEPCNLYHKADDCCSGNSSLYRITAAETCERWSWKNRSNGSLCNGHLNMELRHLFYSLDNLLQQWHQDRQFIM